MRKVWLIEGIIICAIVVWIGSVLDNGQEMQQQQDPPRVEVPDIPVA